MSDMSEEELKALLASLYKEPEKDEYFEERFTQKFHERVVQSAICTPPSRRLWDDFCQFFANMTMPKLAYSAVAVATIFAGVSSLSFLTPSTPGVKIAQKNHANLTHLRASLGEVLGASITKMDDVGTDVSSGKLPSRLGIRLAPPQHSCSPNYTGVNVMTPETPPLYLEGATIYLQPSGSDDNTLNIILIEPQ